MLSDLQIANKAKLKPIVKVAKKIGIEEKFLDYYGKYMAKIDLDILNVRSQSLKKAKYIDVTAITPTPLGEGKTTTTVGLGMALNKLKKKAIIAIRQPSMGPTFGIKGGAAGGGYAQVVPMQEFNLHMTGDIHAVSIAHNLIAAMLDNHILKGNKLNIDIDSISWNRVVDVSDRALRSIEIGSLDYKNKSLKQIKKLQKEFGIKRKTRFDISVASELMAILALSKSLKSMRNRIGAMVIAYDKSGKSITAEDIKAAGAACVLMKEAIKPNLVQTLDNTPAFVHAGPFANIAHGNSSIIADLIGIKLSDFLITESGFGADIGMEKFMNIKCRYSGLFPDAVVLVATVRALKYHSGKFDVVAGKSLPKKMLKKNINALKKGIENLQKQIQNAKSFGIPVVVALNKFESDCKEEIDFVINQSKKFGAFEAVVSDVYKFGAKGGIDLAKAVVKASNDKSKFAFSYDVKKSIKYKIKKIAKLIYGARDVVYSKNAEKQIKKINFTNYNNLPICMAKTHLSLSDNPKLINRPRNFTIMVREVKLAAGAGFIYPILGKIRTMPGLPTYPNAEKIDIDENGDIVGLS